MSHLAIILIILSAFTHATWNLLGKRQRPTAAFFLLANIAGTLCLGILGVPYFLQMPTLPSSVWVLLVITGICQTIYFSGLSNGYRHGDLSIIYPAARGLPALLVVLISLLWGRADQISNQSILGCTLIVVGCVILPMRQFRDFRVDNYRNLSSLFALIAALGTVGYSFIDDEALRQLRNMPGTSLKIWQITLVYAFFEGVFTTIWMALVALPYVRTDLDHLLKTSWQRAILTGVIIAITYLLVLISMAFVTHVSYVVGFRQLSIPLGALLGIIMLKEPAHKPRLLGVGILFIGLILIATG